jgi:hypothetical protein
MRYLVILLMLCLSATAGESTNSAGSLEQFSKQMRQSYEKKDDIWRLNHTDKTGMPSEIVAAVSQQMKEFFDSGIEVTSVETFQFRDYTPKHPGPGEFQGRRLRYVGVPTHWIVLKGQGAKPIKFGWKHEIPVCRKNGHWSIVGVAYAD